MEAKKKEKKTERNAKPFCGFSACMKDGRGVGGVLYKN